MTGYGRRLTFRMEEHFGDGHELRLALVGELDVAVAKLLTERLSELRRGGYTVRLDLLQLEFIDSSGLRELIREVGDSREAGWGLEIDPRLSDAVRRVIDMVGARSYFWPERG